MKKILLPTLMILTSTIFLAIIPTDAECAIYNDTIRLHILANSDSETDQNLKMLLRDEILDEYGHKLSQFKDIDQAKNELKTKLTEIECFADKTVRELGYEYKTEVTLTTEWYDTREYEDFTLPCGYYASLRIIIGQGEGKNWWCVMFPPLCLDAALSSPKYSYEEEILISKKYNVKFKLLELITEIAK